LNNNLTLSSKYKFLILSFSALLIELLLIFFNLFNGNGNIPLYMFTYFEIFLIFSLSFFVIKTKQTRDDSHFLPRVNIPLFIIIAGIIFRITLIPSVPTTSPDVYRYIWEGKIISHGFNPYISPPDAPILNQYRSNIWTNIGFRHMTTIYPPFAQLSFYLGYLISGDKLWGLKLIYLFCEIITLIFILKILRLRKLNPGYVILYAWLPLPVMEYFINAHIDVVGITFLILFLYHLEKGRTNVSAIFFAISFLVKFYPIMLFPLLIKKIGIKKLLPLTLIFILISSIFYFPFITKDLAIKNALTTYLLRWEFNGSVYNLLKLVSDGNIARILCGIMLIISVAVISFKYRDFINAAFGVLLSVIIFATTVYPWYLGWISALNPVLNFYSILSLLFTSNFSNFTPLGKVWQEYWRVLVIEYIPFFILLYVDLHRRIFHKHANPSSS
jgi:alpha-1,6-mannosyltransferase